MRKRQGRDDHRRQTTPASTGGSKLMTHVRDPRATVRFALDERVWWNEGSRRSVGTIIGFAEDECVVKVRLDDGSVVLWPTFSARLKRVETSTFDEDKTAPDGLTATLPNIDGDPYMELSVEGARLDTQRDVRAITPDDLQKKGGSK